MKDELKAVRPVKLVKKDPSAPFVCPWCKLMLAEWGTCQHECHDNGFPRNQPTATQERRGS